MLYVKSESGVMVPITYSNTFAKCPKCGTMHQIDLADILACTGGDVEEATAYCEKCSAKHMPMFENADKLQTIADRFGVHLGEVQRIVQSGLDHDLSFQACLIGARLALSMESGKRSFSPWMMYPLPWGAVGRKPLPNWRSMGSKGRRYPRSPALNGC